MKPEHALIPIEQKQVSFYEDQVTAVAIRQGNQRRVYVPLRPICDLLGVDWSAQRQRINRDPVLSTVVSSIVVTPPAAESKFANPQEMLCLPLDYLNGWLFGISAARVKDDIRDRLIRYQRDCYRALYEAFQEGQLTEPSVEELFTAGDSEAVQAYRMLQALVKLARNQVLMEAQLGEHNRRLLAHDQQLAGHSARLEELEATLGNDERLVTPEQASQISQAVKAIAMKLTDRSGRNEYGGVYGELYRRFSITGYKQLPAARFDDAIQFLTDWHQRLAGPSPF